MLRFAASRILQLLPILIGMSIGVFLLIHFLPGDAAAEVLGEGYTETRAQELREQLGLNRSLPTQFGQWFANILKGDFGFSIFLRKPVAQLLTSKGLVTLTLAVLTITISVLIAIPLGVISAMRQDSWLDNLIRIITMVGISMPVFWFGLLLLLLFSLKLGLLPPGGGPSQYGAVAYILPAATLGIAHAALITRMTRAAMLETIQQDYMRTAKSKGLSNRTVYYKHGFRNAVIPVVTIIGLQFGALLSGAVLTEYIFSLPGLGTLLIDSVHRRDFPVIQGAVLLIGFVFSLVTLLVDITYAALDPRIRY